MVEINSISRCNRRHSLRLSITPLTQPLPLNNNNVDNAVLASLLPGIVDGTIDLVLRNQGPRPFKECADEDKEKDSPFLPGAFKLLYDENKEFEFVRLHQGL